MGEIPAKSSRYFIKQQFSDGGTTFRDGYIYSLIPEQAETFAVSAEHVSFPAIEKIEIDIDSAVDQYKQQRDEIRSSRRFEQNEPERSYQLQQLRSNLDEKISQLSVKYGETAQLIKADLAKKSAQIEIKEAARQRASEIIDMATVQLSYSSNQVDVLDLLQVQIKQQDEDTRTAIGLQFAKLLTALKEGTARETAGSIFSQLESAGMREFKTKSRHLDVLTRDHNPLSSYHQMSILEGRERR